MSIQAHRDGFMARLAERGLDSSLIKTAQIAGAKWNAPKPPAPPNALGTLAKTQARGYIQPLRSAGAVGNAALQTGYSLGNRAKGLGTQALAYGKGMLNGGDAAAAQGWKDQTAANAGLRAKADGQLNYAGAHLKGMMQDITAPIAAIPAYLGGLSAGGLRGGAAAIAERANLGNTTVANADPNKPKAPLSAFQKRIAAQPKYTPPSPSAGQNASTGLGTAVSTMGVRPAAPAPKPVTPPMATPPPPATAPMAPMQTGAVSAPAQPPAQAPVAPATTPPTQQTGKAPAVQPPAEVGMPGPQGQPQAPKVQPQAPKVPSYAKTVNGVITVPDGKAAPGVDYSQARRSDFMAGGRFYGQTPPATFKNEVQPQNLAPSLEGIRHAADPSRMSQPMGDIQREISQDVTRTMPSWYKSPLTGMQGGKTYKSAYARGFLATCERRGHDPIMITKLAQATVDKYFGGGMGTATHETNMASDGAMLGGLGGAAIGGIGGAALGLAGKGKAGFLARLIKTLALSGGGAAALGTYGAGLGLYAGGDAGMPKDIKSKLPA